MSSAETVTNCSLPELLAAFCGSCAQVVEERDSRLPPEWVGMGEFRDWTNLIIETASGKKENTSGDYPTNKNLMM